MAPSFDYAAGSLLCVEGGGFQDGAEEEEEEDLDGGWYSRVHQDKNFDESLNWRLPEELTDESSLGNMLEKESEHLLGRDYLDKLRGGDSAFLGRKEAVNWIAKVNLHFKFSPMCAYLSINYMDRFLSAYDSELIDRVLKCLESIQKAPIVSVAAVSSVPQSPNAVLDSACLSCNKTDESTSSPAQSDSNTLQSSSSVKRRKL